MYTLQQIEEVAVRVFASVTDTDDTPSKLRMKAITELYFGMLANKSSSIDEDALDVGSAALVAHFLGSGARAQRAPAADSNIGLA